MEPFYDLSVPFLSFFFFLLSFFFSSFFQSLPCPIILSPSLSRLRSLVFSPAILSAPPSFLGQVCGSVRPKTTDRRAEPRRSDILDASVENGFMRSKGIFERFASISKRIYVEMWESRALFQRYERKRLYGVIYIERVLYNYV